MSSNAVEPRWREVRTIANHAGTVWVGQLAVMAFAVIDTVLAGRYAPEMLAALSIGTAIYISVYVGLQGCIQSLLPIWARLFGSQQLERLAYSVRQSLYIVAGCSFLGASILAGASSAIMQFTDTPQALRPMVSSYLQIQAAILPIALLARVFGTFAQSVGMPRWVTGLQLLSLTLKFPLSIWLTFGGMGVPALGLNGCALATLIAQSVQLLCMGYLLRHSPAFSRFQVWQPLQAPDRTVLREFLALALPSSFAIWVEVTAFTMMSLLVAPMGTTASASQQIASNMAAILFMWPLALAIATSARVSYWHGAQQSQLANNALRMGLGIAALSALLATTVVIGFRQPLAQLYIQQPEVVQLAASLLALVALYHLADALQIMGLFVLRSFGVVRAPTLIYTLALWGVGMGGGYTLSRFEAWHSPATFWMTNALAMAVVAVLFMVVLRRAVQRYGR